MKSRTPFFVWELLVLITKAPRWAIYLEPFKNRICLRDLVYSWEEAWKAGACQGVVVSALWNISARLTTFSSVNIFMIFNLVFKIIFLSGPVSCLWLYLGYTYVWTGMDTKPHIFRRMTLAYYICHVMLLPDLVWWMLTESQRGSTPAFHYSQTRPFYIHYIILCYWAEPHAHCTRWFRNGNKKLCRDNSKHYRVGCYAMEVVTLWQCSVVEAVVLGQKTCSRSGGTVTDVLS
jgi:hypothetical protein